MTRQDVGKWGEDYVATQLRERGYGVSIGNKGVDSDLVVTFLGRVIQVEVKAATQGKDKKWRATLIKNGHTNHNKADIVVLICQNKAEITFFIVPVKDIVDRRHMVITSNPRTYQGVWSHYRHESLVI